MRVGVNIFVVKVAGGEQLQRAAAQTLRGKWAGALRCDTASATLQQLQEAAQLAKAQQRRSRDGTGISARCASLVMLASCRGS